MVRRHVYDGERCIHCGVNIYDQWIYGADDESDCNDREPMAHTSQSPSWDDVFGTIADFDTEGDVVPRKHDEEAAARQIDRSVWMTREEAATALGTQHRSIKPLIDSGDLQGLQRGKRWYVSRRSVEAYKKRR